jgi:hypothetical protein
MIFNNTGRFDPIKFTCNKNIVENVRKYWYLGVVFSNSGSFTEANKELYQKSLKVYFKFRKCFEHHKPKINTLLHFYMCLIIQSNQSSPFRERPFNLKGEGGGLMLWFFSKTIFWFWWRGKKMWFRVVVMLNFGGKKLGFAWQKK